MQIKFLFYFYKMLFLFILFSTIYAGEIMCNLCVDTVQHVKDIVEDKGIEAAREYLDNLCDKTPGFISNVCEDFVNFGMDEILKLIENRVQPKEICEKINICDSEFKNETCDINYELQGTIICSLCTGLIERLKEILETHGADKIKAYLESLCDKASGFINTLCDKLVNFGIDKLIELIENKIDSNVICQKINVC